MTSIKKNNHDVLLNPKDLLEKIEPKGKSKDRLQFWDSNLKILGFACGNGEEAVYIQSNKELSFANRTLNSRLDKAIWYSFLQDEQVVQAATIVCELKQILREYIHFEDERLYLLITFWIIGTYCYTDFGHFGYLFFHSKLMRSGKTRIQEIISHLAYEASQPQNAPTAPVIRELAAEGGTVQLDTLERWQEKNKESFSAAMEMLDAGFRNGGQVSKMASDGNGKWIKESYQVYAPYVLSGIYEDSLSDTARDRSFCIEMKRKNIGIKKRRYNYHNCEKECSPIRGHLYAWALTNALKIDEIYQSVELQKGLNNLHLNDRAADIWMPVLAIARATGFDKDSIEWHSLCSLAQEMGGDPEYAEDVHLLAIIRGLRSIADEKGKIIGMTSTLVASLQLKGVEVTEHRLTHLLKQFGFEQKSVRLEGEPRRAWELDDEKLAEIEEQLKAAVMPDSEASEFLPGSDYSDYL